MKSRPAQSSRRGSPRLRRILRELHHQTWELELLISGLVTFALLQIPTPLDRTFQNLRLALPEGAALVATLSFAYAKLAIYGLLAAFLFHLVVRAFWVALVGLDSVFPRGLRAERLRQGPLALEYAREELPPVRRLIALSDEIASVVFAVGFSLVAVFVISVPTIGGLLALGYGIAAVLPWETEPIRVFWWVWALFLAFAVVPTLLDRVFGRRLPPGSSARRALKAALRGFYRLTGFPIYGPIQLTLASNLGPRATTVASASVVLLLAGIFVVRDGLVGSGDLQIVGSPFLPLRASEVSLDSEFYDDRRSPGGGGSRVPSIESTVVSSSFLRLFIPYRPSLYDARLRERCPGLEAVGNAGVRLVRSSRADSAHAARVARSRDALACAAAMWSITLNGRPTGVDPVFSAHPTTGVRGLLYMVPTRGLEEGRQLLRITEVVDVESLDVSAPREYPIVFWWAQPR